MKGVKMTQVTLILLQSQVQLHWRQRSTGSGRESESQPLTTEPEVRAALCMSLSGDSGKEEGLHFLLVQILVSGLGT